MPSSVFDRLASQGTASSRVREAEEIASRTKQEQKRATNAKATTPKRNTIKEQALKPPQDQKAKSPKRTQQQQNDFLNRLSKQETASSAAHHTIDRQSSHISPKKSTPKPKKKLTPSEKSAVFNRLYKQETSATKAHHVKEEKVSTATTTSPMKKKCTPPPSLLKRIEDEKKAEKSGGSSTITPIQMKLHIRTKDDKKENKPYSNLEMPESEVRRQINLYHSKKISAHALAYDIMNVLFDRKFVPTAGGAQQWDVGTAILEELDCITDKTILTIEEDKDDIVCYSACKEAVHTKEDMKFVKAKCTIKISSENVYVDDYSYEVTK